MLRNELYKPWFVGEADWGFEITDGEFKDVCIQIEKLDIGDGEANNLKLDYHTIRKPELITEVLFKLFTPVAKIFAKFYVRLFLPDGLMSMVLYAQIPRSSSTPQHPPEPCLLLVANEVLRSKRCMHMLRNTRHHSPMRRREV